MVVNTFRCVLLHIITLAVFVSAADQLAFKSPSFNQRGAAGFPYFNLGQKVTVSWTTPFKSTTLALVQKRAGALRNDVLAEAKSADDTTFTWTVGPIDGIPTRGSSFYFTLANADDRTCAGCTINSPIFTFRPAGEGDTASSSSKTKNNPSKSTSSGSPSSSAAGSNSTNAPPKNSKSGNSSAVAIGVGVGIGVPVAIAAVVVAALLIRRHRKREGYEGPMQHSGYSDAGSPSPPPQMHQKFDRFSRESGALGPWGNDSAADNARPQHDSWGPKKTHQLQVVNINGNRAGARISRDPPKQLQVVNASIPIDEEDGMVSPVSRDGPVSPISRDGVSEGHSLRDFSQTDGYAPFKPPTTPFGDSQAGSRCSWIEEFEFEKPGFQSTDDFSEVRKSISESHRPKPSDLDKPLPSRASIGKVSDIPHIPQLRHKVSQPSDNWPLR